MTSEAAVHLGMWIMWLLGFVPAAYLFYQIGFGAALRWTERNFRLLPCGHPKEFDDSYGGCVFCGYKNGYHEQEAEVEALQARVKELDNREAQRISTHMAVVQSLRAENEGLLSKVAALRKAPVRWLIESGRPWATVGPFYLRVWVNSGLVSITWTDDPNEALAFCRKQDAEFFWYLHPEPANIPRIVEHGWIDAAMAAGEKP